MSKIKMIYMRLDTNLKRSGHIEAPGCIINVRVVKDMHGQLVTAVEIIADGDRFAAEPEWWIEGKKETTRETFVLLEPPPGMNDASQSSPLTEDCSNVHHARKITLA